MVAIFGDGVFSRDDPDMEGVFVAQRFFSFLSVASLRQAPPRGL